MSRKTYQEMITQHSAQSFRKAEQSRIWYRQNATRISKGSLNRNDIIDYKKVESLTMTDSLIGKLFMFLYDPKTKETLPYYDAYPLVFPFRIVKDGFYGLNMHYLPPVLRAALMDKLYSLANTRNIDSDKMRLAKMSYDVLNASSNFSGFKPCVKHYLLNHIKTKVAYIPPSEWELALFLPLQMFKKKSETVVWAESKKTYNKAGK